MPALRRDREAAEDNETAAATSTSDETVLQVWSELLQGEWVMTEFNRRELLSGLVATLAAGGVAASADVAEPVAGDVARAGSVDLDKIDALMEAWRRRAIGSRKCGDKTSSEVGRASCDARFWAYFNCINELRAALGLPGLGEA